MYIRQKYGKTLLLSFGFENFLAMASSSPTVLKSDHAFGGFYKKSSGPISR